MKEEQFEAVVAVGIKGSLAVISCDSELVIEDIICANISGAIEINEDWECSARGNITLHEEWGTYKVTGILAISDDREQLDYTTTWERIA
jgi:hypothetical protein